MHCVTLPLCLSDTAFQRVKDSKLELPVFSIALKTKNKNIYGKVWRLMDKQVREEMILKPELVCSLWWHSLLFLLIFVHFIFSFLDCTNRER